MQRVYEIGSRPYYDSSDPNRMANLLNHSRPHSPKEDPITDKTSVMLNDDTSTVGFHYGDEIRRMPVDEFLEFIHAFQNDHRDLIKDHKSRKNKMNQF